jgi:hypothetical protein
MPDIALALLVERDSEETKEIRFLVEIATT